jgi:crotonobetainyl-CoA:carnitine CoA-transferase CaiB-like acyl-CoA transferase
VLSPYRVLDLTDHRGEIGPMLLGDLGADVIRIEPPGGVSARRAGALIPADRSREDLRSYQFRAFNRNKRSIVLDLAVAGDRSDFESLIRSADFVIESGPDGYAATNGFDFERLKSLNPLIVHVLLTPWGHDGPAANRIATDLTLSAMGGQAALQGAPERAPVRISVPQIWRHAGAEAAAAAMIAHQRMQRIGTAQFVDLSAQCVTTWTTMNAMDAHAIQGFNFERRGSTVQMGTREVDPVFPCADGFLVALPVGTVIEPLLGHLAGEDLIDGSWLEEDWLTIDQRRTLGESVRFTREQQRDVLAKFFLNHTKAELFAIGIELGITLAPVNSVADLLQFEQIAARDAWSEIALDDGASIRAPGRIALFDVGRVDLDRDEPSGTPAFRAAVRRRAPGLDEHGAQIRAELRSGRRLAQPPRLRLDESGRPFAGLKVLDLTWIIAGPSSARYFSDHGGTVIKVESELRPDGLRLLGPQKGGTQWNSSHFHGEFNAGKQCVQLNLKNPEGLSIMKRLIAWADVFIENWAPGALRRLGIDYSVVRELNPEIIMLSTSLMGQTGPASEVAGFGYHAGGMAGFYEVTGWPDLPPQGPWMAYTDVIAPRMIAAMATAAIDRRVRTGRGQHIDAAQFEMALQFLAPEIMEVQTAGYQATRLGNRSRFAAPEGIYPCAGSSASSSAGSGTGADQWLAISIETDAQWRALCTVLGEPAWCQDPTLATLEGRLDRHDEIDTHLSAWTVQQDRYAAMDILLQAGVPAGALQRSSDLACDPQYQHRQFHRFHDHPVMGRVPYAGVQYRIPGYEAGPYRFAPLLGEHTERVLAEELGMTAEEIRQARDAGALQ